MSIRFMGMVDAFLAEGRRMAVNLWYNGWWIGVGVEWDVWIMFVE